MFKPIVRSILLLLSAAGVYAQPATTPPAKPKYFEPAVLLDVQVSPSGKWLAARTRFDDQHYSLTLIDPQTRARQVLTQADGMSVQWYCWKNDDLLFFFVREDKGYATFRSIDLKKGKINNLEDFRAKAQVTVADILPDDPESILIYYSLLETDAIGTPVSQNDVIRLNVATGASRVVEEDLGGTRAWFANRKGEVVGALGQVKDQWYFASREPGKKWQRIEHPKGEMPLWMPWGLASDQRRFIVSARDRGPCDVVCFYDPVTGAFEEVAGPAGFDPLEPLRWGIHNEPAVAAYAADDSLRFLSPDAEDCHRWLGSVFPGLQVRCVSVSQDTNRVVVHVSSGANPGTYFFADRALKKVLPIGNKFAGVNPNQMNPSRAFEFKSSDGLTIHGRLTSPSGSGKLPLVLLVDPLGVIPTPTLDFRAQFFAAQGYAVAQIYHRGTMGFGRNFAIAGDLQIGDAMGRDLVEGVKWMGEQGWIDPERVALYSSGGGGIVAMPLATQKGVFKAFINYNGVLDLSLVPIGYLFYTGRSTAATLAAAGGRKGFDAYRKSIDPLAAAAKIEIPSLHIYDRLANNSFLQGFPKLQSTLKKNAGGSELVLGEARKAPPAPPPAAWIETTRHHEEIAAFLKKTL